MGTNPWERRASVRGVIAAAEFQPRTDVVKVTVAPVQGLHSNVTVGARLECEKYSYQRESGLVRVCAVAI